MIVKYILNLTRPAMVKLQSEEMDLLNAEQDVQTNLDQKHRELYDEAVQLAAEVDIEPSRPRIVQRQINRPNAAGPGTSPIDYYRINLTRVFLDHVLEQLRSRFPPQAYTCYKGFSIVPLVRTA